MAVIISIFFFLNYIYEDGDSLLVVNDSFVICDYHQYNLKVNLVDNAKLKVRQWDGSDSTGKLILQAPFINIHNSTIDGSGKGYSGGTNTHPNGYGPGCGYSGAGGGRIKVFCAILDKNHLSLSVGSGAGGYGGYGNGENERAGTIYFGPLVVEENITENFLKTKIRPLITNGRLMLFFERKS
uniref:Uncharacterized protein n=1 Tax=candidate division WOR-3 bacterium TaxID=2052148 RepID=A0A7V0Z7X6_UNCW3